MKKIKGIFVCMILIATAIPVVGTIENDNPAIREASNYYNNLIKKVIECGILLDNDWSEEEKLLPSDGASDDRFGFSVSINGNYSIIGSPNDDDNGDNSGSAYVFTRSGSVWTQQAKLLASDGSGGDQFGCSVSIDGDSVIVGSRYDDESGDDSGSAYVFTRTGSVWTQQAKLLASDGALNDCFGETVSINDDSTIIGSPYDDDNGDNSGSAYIFTRTASVWTQQAKLLASDGASGDCFASSVSIDGDSAIMGAPNDKDNGPWSGSAYVFTRSGSVWTQQAKLLPSDGASEDYFGKSVSIDGDSAIMGAHEDDDNGGNSGSAYVFTRTASVWTQQAKLLASDGASSDWFGYSVSIEGESVIVGSHYNDDNGGESGSAYVFNRSGSVWTQQGKLLPSDGASEDHFGFSVSIDGNYTVIGSRFDDDNGDESGSAYVFIKDGGGNQIPLIEITYPEESDIVSGTITINGTSDDPDGTVELVEVKIDDDSWEEASGTTSWSYEWDTTTVTEGQHVINARSYDGEDYSNIAMVNVTVDNIENQIPTVEITYPEEGDTISGTITIDGASDDPDGTVELVEVKIDDNSWEEASGITSWSYEWDTTTVTNGQHVINARSYDGEDYSNIAMVNITVDNGGNQPPNAPTIDGPTSGKKGTKYDYTFTATDPDGDDVKYYIDWGDGSTEWTDDFTASEEPVTVSHIWTSKDTFIITTKAQDEHGLNGPEGSLEVTMPKDKSLIYRFPFLTWLFERFQNISPFFNYLFRL